MGGGYGSGFLTQESEPIQTTIVDVPNGLNNLSRLAMLWTVRNCWPVGPRFTFNFYKHCEHLILHHPRDPPGTLLSREGVTQGDPLLMVLYAIKIIPSVE